MQKGFSLIELLIASLLSSFIVLAAGQAFTSLVKFHTAANNQLRINENALLADLAIKNILHASQAVKLAGAATSNKAASNSNFKVNLGSGLGELNFTQLNSSGWLLLEDKQNENKFNLLHLDKKTHGQGLAYKSHVFNGQADRSDTLVDEVERINWHFYNPLNRRWLSANEVEDFSQVTALSYVLEINSPQENLNSQANSLVLGGSFLLTP